MTWRSSRKLSIVLIILAFFGLVFAGLYYKYKPAPTCFDGKQNGVETGVDCGGNCPKVCPNTVNPLTVRWARPLMINKGEYTVVALIENTNLNLGAGSVVYKVSLLNKGGTVIGGRTGQTFVNPNEKFVIFEPALNVGSDTPVKAFVDFDSNINWQKPPVDKAVISVVRKSFATSSAPALGVSVTNTSVYPLTTVLVPVVISDINGNAISASATFIDGLDPKQAKDVNFTWREPFLAEPAYVDFYPRANSFDLQ